MHTLTWPISEPIVIFAIVMILLLLVPIGMQRLKLPGVVGLIFAGLLLGPNMLNLLERDSTFQLFGAVGLQYIVFAAGLELDLAGFQRVRFKAIGFGVLSFLLPLGIGTLAATTILGFDLPSAVLLGSVFGSHTLLAYPIASRLGLSKHEPVTVTVGATLVTDISALLVLAIVANSTEGDLDAIFWIKLGIGAVIFGGLVLFGLPRLARWFFMKRDSDGIEAFLFVIAAVFLSAWIAELAGLVSIIGAFLAGFVLNRLIPSTSPLANRLNFVGNALFIPFFLISVGMLANLWVLLDGIWSWVVAIVMCVAVVSTKWTAAQLGGWVLGYKPQDRSLMFGLSVPQAAATLAAVMIGYKLGLFDDSVLNGTIIMIIVTCVVGPSVVETSGRQIARELAESTADNEEAPQRILVPLANPDSATQLLDLSLMIRDELSDQPIYPLAVVDEAVDVDVRLARAEKLLSGAVLHGAAAHVPIRPVTRIHSNVSRSILSAARDTRTSHVIVGWDGQRSRFGRTYGRVLDPVVAESECALFVCYQRQPVSTLARVLLAVAPYADRHPGFTQLIHDLKLMAQRLGAPLVLVLPPEGADDVAARIRAARPSVPTTIHKLGTWRGLLGGIAEHIHDDDLFVLISARPGTIAYDPTLDRLPSEITRRFTELDLVVAYPAEPNLLDSADDPRGEDLDVTVQTLTFEPALREIVDAIPELSDGARRALHQNLVARARASSTELTPGVLLLDLQHARVPSTFRIIARSTEGITFPQATDAVQVLILLLSTADRPAGAHMTSLSRIAMGLRRGDQLATLLAEPTTATLHDLLDPGAGGREAKVLPAPQPDP